MANENDDLEFATKEDLEKINASPELKRLYDAMKAGVTKKFQTYASEKKQLMDTLTAYETTLRQWEEWRPIIDSYTKGDLDHDDGKGNGDGDREGSKGGRKGKGGGYDDDGFRETFTGFQDEVRKLADGFKNELTTMNRMMNLSLQLGDLERSHFVKYPDIKFDRDKILATALERGYQNLEDAYSTIYRDDFMKKDVETQLTSRLAEEKAKLRTQGETGSSATPLIFKPPEKAPTNFNEASQQVLNEIKAGTLTKE